MGMSACYGECEQGVYVCLSASEPKPRTVDITDTDLATIELHMRRLGVPHPRRMRMMADAVEGAPDALR